MAYPKSLKTNFVVKSVASAGVHSSALKPLQLGIIDTSNYNTIAAGSVGNNEVLLAVGSPNQGQAFAGLKVERFHDQLNSNISFKSQPITNAKEILTQKFSKDDQENVYYLGWNGLNNACKSLEFECGKTYQFDIYVKGRPIRNIFGQEMREVIEFTTPCCDCSGTDCDTSLNCGAYIDQLVSKFNDPNRWLSRFFKAETVVDCISSDPVAVPTTDTTNVYCLTICDNGDEIDLAAVQAQYSDYDVTVKERSAPYTTYQLYSDSLPTPYTHTPTITLDCECPTGYTEVPAQNVYSVKVDPQVYNDNFSVNAATTLEVLLGLSAGDISTDGSLTTVDAGADVLCYEVSVLTTVTPDADAVVAVGVTATLVDTTEATCTSTTTNTGWVLCDTAYKVYRSLCVTVATPDCPENAVTSNDELLTDWLTFATDNDLTNAAIESSGDCVAAFTADQLSNEWIEDGCDTVGWRQAKWDILPPFKGQRLASCPCEGYTIDDATGCVTGPEADTSCCQCGIKFTTHDFRTMSDLLGAPVYDINEYLEKDPIELTVGLLHPDGDTQACIDDQPDFWWAKRATYRTLQGRDVLKEILTERFYRQEPYWNLTDKMGLLLNHREGLKYGVDLDAYYFAVTLSHNVANDLNWTGHGHSVREDIVLFIHEDDAAVYDQVIATLRQAFPVPVKSLNA